jgi:L-xylulose reductase
VTLTAMARKAWSDPEKSGPVLKRMPLGRFIEPEEVAEVVLFLLSDRASMVNGISMPIDSGYQVTP